jgi:hypothetical protein
MKHRLVSHGVKLTPGTAMSFRQLEHLFVSSVGSFSAPSSWQVFLLRSLGVTLLSLFVWQKPPYPLLVCRRDWYRFIIETLSSGSLLPPEVALAAFGSHQFAATRSMKTALRAFMSFQFWHLFLSP